MYSIQYMCVCVCARVFCVLYLENSFRDGNHSCTTGRRLIFFMQNAYCAVGLGSMTIYYYNIVVNKMYKYREVLIGHAKVKTTVILVE